MEGSDFDLISERNKFAPQNISRLSLTEILLGLH